MKNKYDIELPQSIIESLARALIPELRKFYQSEQGQIEFEKWQNEQKNKIESKSA